MKGVWLEDLTWPEADRKLRDGWHVVIPVGARSKEHGRHLPLKTDYMLARALCDGVIAQLEVLVAPVIDFGYYPAFDTYPGSQHLDATTFMAVLEQLIEPFIRQKARMISIVNTGVSTEGPIQIVVRKMLARYDVQIAVADINRLGKSTDHLLSQKLGGHGDEHETSIILAIDPSVVRMDEAEEDYGNMLSEPRTVFYRPSRFNADPNSGTNYSVTGVRGDPTLATAEKGRQILSAQIADLVDGLRKLDRTLG